MTSLERNEIIKAATLNSCTMRNLASTSQLMLAVEDQFGKTRILDSLPCYKEVQHAINSTILFRGRAEGHPLLAGRAGLKTEEWQ